MIIPDKLKKILEKDQASNSLVLDIITSFEPIPKDNKLFFFEEYTDHGIEHIEMVLKASEFLIPEDSFEHIKPKEVAILILATVLHDIGMHVEFSTFKAMVDGKYDDVKIKILDKKTWKDLWQDYLSEARHFSSKQLKDIFGDSNEKIKYPDLSNKDKLNGTDKKLIGEFIRRHHARLAHEIALKGFIGNNDVIPFGNDKFSKQDRQLAGIVARSHGMNIRDTFEYLEKIAQCAWKNPEGLNVMFLMVLIRIADYLQIDKTRTNITLLKIKSFNSHVSLQEHQKHLDIRYIHFGTIKEPEFIYVECNNPSNAQMYVKIQTLIKDIQHELDLSWAVLGEIYGFQPTFKPKIKFRRIDSNLEHSDVLDELDYVPKKIAFKVNNELSKLLVAPLYGNHPTYGVRELVQNATDACKERIKIEKDKGNTYYESQALVTVSIDNVNDEQYLFKIKDNGKGMTLDEILNYFLSVGSSFRNSFEWKQEFASNSIKRNGRFGIGILAAFLLGDEISVKTKSYKENISAYEFKTKINSEHIDIYKLDNFEVGTEIEIIMSNEKYELLTKKYENIIFWTDWYVNTIPIIDYVHNGKKFQKHNKTPPDLKEIFHKDYEKIQWIYKKPKCYHSYYGMFISCNDIIITLSSKKKQFQYEKSKPEDSNYIITEKPSLYIEDTQGILPLRLDRNDLDSETLPFEEDLLLDVAKDFIAKLLMLQINPKKIENFKIPPHRINFLFLKNGFTLSSDYFIDKVPEEFNLLRIITNHHDTIECHLSIFQKSDKVMIFSEFDTRINLAFQEHNVAPKEGGCILLLKEKYNNLFKNGNTKKAKKFHKIAKKRHKIEWENEKYLVYNIENYRRKTNIFDKEICTSIIKNLDREIQSIQELPFSFLKKIKGGRVLNELFEKYFGKNIIIPYDIEKRKNLYPLAFDELKDYMKYYLK